MSDQDKIEDQAESADTSDSGDSGVVEGVPAIDWSEVTSAVAREDGLHITRKDGTLGVLSMQNAQANAGMQRRVYCTGLSNVINALSQALGHLLQLKASGKPPNTPAGNWEQGLNDAIASTKKDIAAIQDLMRATGCG